MITSGLSLVAVLSGTCLAALGVSSVHATIAEPVDAGEVVVVDPGSRSQVISGGGSATPFSLDLPDGASCPGDTANDQWRVQTFIVPAFDDPGELLYDGQKPVGDGRWALYRITSEAHNQIETEMNDLPGRPARIPEFPALSLAVFSPDILPPGDYRMGVVCTHFRDPGPYWDVQVELRFDRSDQPAQLTWKVPGGQTPLEGRQRAWSSPLVVISAAGLLLVALGALYVARLRQRRPTDLERSTTP